MRTDLQNFMIAAEHTAPIWAFILLCCGIAALFIWAEQKANREREAREELNAATLHHVTRCNARRDGLWCDRAADHDGHHVDSRHGSELGWARWVA